MRKIPGREMTSREKTINLPGRDDLGRYDTKPFSMYNPRAVTPMSGSRLKTMAGVVRRIIQTSKAPSAVGAYRYK